MVTLPVAWIAGSASCVYSFTQTRRRCCDRARQQQRVRGQRRRTHTHVCVSEARSTGPRFRFVAFVSLTTHRCALRMHVLLGLGRVTSHKCEKARRSVLHTHTHMCVCARCRSKELEDRGHASGGLIGHAAFAATFDCVTSHRFALQTRSCDHGLIDPEEHLCATTNVRTSQTHRPRHRGLSPFLLKHMGGCAQVQSEHNPGNWKRDHGLLASATHMCLRSH